MRCTTSEDKRLLDGLFIEASRSEQQKSHKTRHWCWSGVRYALLKCLCCCAEWYGAKYSRGQRGKMTGRRDSGLNSNSCRPAEQLGPEKGISFDQPDLQKATLSNIPTWQKDILQISQTFRKHVRKAFLLGKLTFLNREVFVFAYCSRKERGWYSLFFIFESHEKTTTNNELTNLYITQTKPDFASSGRLMNCSFWHLIFIFPLLMCPFSYDKFVNTVSCLSL